MAGLHFSCDGWMGNDKSANSLADVIKELSQFVADEEKPIWRKKFLTPFLRQARSHLLKLKPEMMLIIIEPLRRYGKSLAQQIGLPDPDAEITGEWDDVAWKLYCVRDMIRGNETCQQSGKPIIVCFA